MRWNAWAVRMAVRGCGLPGLLLMGACATAGPHLPPPAPTQTGNGVGSGCTDDGDCASPLYCSGITSTCETNPNWCNVSLDCQQATGDPGSRCMGHVCWGSGVSCKSVPCLEGDGCASDADCDSGWTCSPGNGVCHPPQQPPSQSCPDGLVWSDSYGDSGGCVAPASWPPATSECQSDAHAPPTCLLCSENVYEHGLRCPDHYGYLYGYMGHFYCCLDPPY